LLFAVTRFILPVLKGFGFDGRRSSLMRVEFIRRLTLFTDTFFPARASILRICFSRALYLTDRRCFPLFVDFFSPVVPPSAPSWAMISCLPMRSEIFVFDNSNARDIMRWVWGGLTSFMVLLLLLKCSSGFSVF